jgi:hypothetical protein
MKTAGSYLLLGIIGLTGFVFSLVSMRKENRRGIFWCTLAIVGLCVVVLFADNLEKIGELEIISRRVKAMILGFLSEHADHGNKNPSSKPGCS